MLVRISDFFPATSWLPKYSLADWRGDWPAGLTVGIMLIPQGMAYAMIAGLPVVYGLYAALLPQIVYGFMGTSRHLAVGPVAMDSLLVAAGLTGIAVAGSENYVALALLLAFMMGALQLSMGLLKLGFLVNFLSRPVISGFTSAAALLIGFNQLPHLLGVSSGRSNQLHKLLAGLSDVVSEVHLGTLVVGLFATGGLLALKKWAPRVPGALVVVVSSIVASWAFGFQNLGIKVVGVIPDGLPSFTMPAWSLSDARTLLPTALTLSLVAFMEAISVAKAIEERHGYRVDANQELRALGLANVVGSLFQSYPTTGGFSRTAVAEQAGGKTPVTAWIAAAIIALTLVALTPLFYHLPNAVLAAIVMVAVVGLVDLSYPRTLWKQDRVEAGILLATALVTLTVSLPVGIGLGVLLALGLAVQRMMVPHVAVLGNVENVYRNVDRFENAVTEPDVLVVRYDGALNFANQAHFRSTMVGLVKDLPELQLVVLQADTISYMDASARATVRALLTEWRSGGIQLCLAGAIGPVRDALASDGLLESGAVCCQLTVEDALANYRNPGSVPPSHQDMATQHT
ncbi:MAG: SulP family inorganic anion transporter [Flavobacteriales bacterium]